MTYGKAKQANCAEIGCGKSFLHMKKLSIHIRKEHGLTSYDYVVKHDHGGIIPACPSCGIEVRFVSLGAGFKKFCFDCARRLASDHGKVGGRKRKLWNKGLTKQTDVRVAELALKLSGSGNFFYGKKHTLETCQQIASSKRLPFWQVRNDIQSRLGLTLLSFEQAYECQDSLLDVRCQAGHEFKRSYFNLQRSLGRCHECDPLGSSQELEIEAFIRGELGFNDVVLHDRTALDGLEIDVFVPTKRVGIEHHGLRWHSKSDSRTRALPQRKHELATRAGIKLLQFFGDEWRDKRAICESIIRHSLGLSALSAYARNCRVIQVHAQDAHEFFEANHIDGHTQASVYLSLVSNIDGRHLMMLSLRSPKERARYPAALEIARMAPAINTHVPGGASKLMAHARAIALERGKNELLSYADLRLGVGNTYSLCGIPKVSETDKQRYWYTDGFSRFPRQSVKADRTRSMSQSAVAQERGMSEVHGTKNAVYCGRFELPLLATQIGEATVGQDVAQVIHRPACKPHVLSSSKRGGLKLVSCPHCDGHVSERKGALGAHIGRCHPEITAMKKLTARAAIVKQFKIKCPICVEPVANSQNVLGRHLRSEHNIEYVDHVIDRDHAGKRPVCRCGCGEDAPWTGRCFKAYADGHRHRSTKRFEHEITLVIACLECGEHVASTRSGLMKHVSRMHGGMCAMDYVIKHELRGVRPTCACGCGIVVEWHKSEFRKFRRGHSGRVMQSRSHP